MSPCEEPGFLLALGLPPPWVEVGAWDWSERVEDPDLEAPPRGLLPWSAALGAGTVGLPGPAPFASTWSVGGVDVTDPVSGLPIAWVPAEGVEELVVRRAGADPNAGGGAVPRVDLTPSTLRRGAGASVGAVDGRDLSGARGAVTLGHAVGSPLVHAVGAGEVARVQAEDRRSAVVSGSLLAPWGGSQVDVWGVGQASSLGGSERSGGAVVTRVRRARGDDGAEAGLTVQGATVEGDTRGVVGVWGAASGGACGLGGHHQLSARAEARQWGWTPSPSSPDSLWGDAVPLAVRDASGALTLVDRVRPRWGLDLDLGGRVDVWDERLRVGPLVAATFTPGQERRVAAAYGEGFGRARMSAAWRRSFTHLGLPTVLSDDAELVRLDEGVGVAETRWFAVDGAARAWQGLPTRDGGATDRATVATRGELRVLSVVSASLDWTHTALLAPTAASLVDPGGVVGFADTTTARVWAGGSRFDGDLTVGLSTGPLLGEGAPTPSRGTVTFGGVAVSLGDDPERGPAWSVRGDLRWTQLAAAPLWTGPSGMEPTLAEDRGWDGPRIGVEARLDL